MGINWIEVAYIAGTYVLLPFAVSVLAAWFFWMLTFQYTNIDIVFSDKLEKRKDVRNGATDLYRYRVRIVNMGKRDLIEVSMIAKVTVKTMENSKRKIHSTYFPVGEECVIPIIHRKRSKKEIQDANRPEDRKEHRTMLYGLYTDDRAYTEYAKNIYDESIRKKAIERTLVIDDIFAVYPEAFMTIYVFGNDCVTGARRKYESKEYTKEDIAAGKFETFEGIAKPNNLWEMAKKQRRKLLVEAISKIAPEPDDDIALSEGWQEKADSLCETQE